MRRAWGVNLGDFDQENGLTTPPACRFRPDNEQTGPVEANQRSRNRDLQSLPIPDRLPEFHRTGFQPVQTEAFQAEPGFRKREGQHPEGDLERLLGQDAGLKREPSWTQLRLGIPQGLLGLGVQGLLGLRDTTREAGQTVRR